MPQIDELLFRYLPELVLALIVFWFWRDSNATAAIERKESAVRNTGERKERDEMWQKFWTDQRALDREIGRHMSETNAAALNELSRSVQSLDGSVQALYTQGNDNNAALSRTVQELKQLRTDFVRLMGRET